MAAFVGYCVQANGFYFPWRLTGGPNPIMHADISAAGSPAEQWDALPIEAKYQIIVRPYLPISPSISMYQGQVPDHCAPHSTSYHR